MAIVKLTHADTGETESIDTDVWSLLNAQGLSDFTVVALQKLGGETWTLNVKESETYVRSKI